jgi:chromatin segregation and condensation protein Rec8/ScpA/Scc1 (kleisin family)
VLYVCFTEKPNWSDIKKKKKELKKTRKEQKCTVYDLIEKSKQLWEKVRRSDCPVEKREKLTLEIHSLLKNKLNKVNGNSHYSLSRAFH